MAVAAREGLSYQDQLDFSGGAHPGMESIPPNGAEDIVNGVLTADGVPFRRGASAFKAGAIGAGVTSRPRSIWDGFLAAGPRTLVTRHEVSTSNERVFALDAADTSWIDLGVVGNMDMPRPVVVGGMLVLPSNALNSAGFAVWGGATGNKATVPSITLTVTNGSRTVTAASGLSAGAEPGTLMLPGTLPFRLGVVQSVQSDTSMTLRDPWLGATGAATFGLTQFSAAPGAPPFTTIFTTGASLGNYAAAMYDRLILAQGSRVAFTAEGDPFVFANDDDYHELPGGARVVGLEPLRDQLLVFTTHGIFTLSGLGFDLTDAQGNTQQRMERSSSEIVLWDNRGIAGWEAAVVAPCTEDVYLIDSAAGTQPILGGMRRLYRSYVRAGYRTGIAATYRDMYFLPIVNADLWVDTLVCDLRSRAWTRWSGHGAGTGFARRVGGGTRKPALLALGGSDWRPLDLSTATEPDLSGSATDADGSTFDMQITTRTLTWGSLIPHEWKRFRARLEGAATTPVVSLEYATGKPGSSFTSVSSPQVKGDDNEQVYSWPVREKTRAVRFRLTIRSGGSREVLRSFQAGARLSSHHRP